MKRLKELRQESGKSQQEVADFLGVSQQAYANYESGKRDPDSDALVKLANFFGTSVDYILENSDAKISMEQSVIAFDDFTYAMYGETRDLGEKDKKMLLEMAKMMKGQMDEGNKEK